MSKQKELKQLRIQAREWIIKQSQIKAAVIYALKNVHPVKLDKDAIQELMPRIKSAVRIALCSRIHPDGELIVEDSNDVLSMAIGGGFELDDKIYYFSSSIVSALHAADIFTLGDLVDRIKNFNLHREREISKWWLGRERNEINEVLESLKIDTRI